jgi:Tol biopolymer transport system component/serine/threonine protein kinase
LTPERWQQVKRIFNGCLELQPAGRGGYLDRACSGDAELRREVESLISAYDSGGDALERPIHPVDDAGALAGRIVGDYRLVREAGEGGMARVYLAERTGEGEPRQAAIKLVKRGMDFDFVLRRFRHERQIMAGLDHPNIAKLLGGGSMEDGSPYFVIEYIPGQPIDEYCDERRLGIRERLELFHTVCSAVRYAHEHGVVHRDIKPGNILVTAGGVPKLLDFGIAKIVGPGHWTRSADMTATVLRLMTPEYASPEQVRGEYIFEPTDIYSLGVLLYELLTGHKPYRLQSRAAHELARAICEQEPLRPSSVAAHREEVGRLPGGTPVVITAGDAAARRQTGLHSLRRTLSGDLDNIVLMALHKEPRQRYASVREMAEDIRRYLDGRPTTARRDAVAVRGRRFLAPGRRGPVAAAASLALALALGAAWWWTRNPSPASAGWTPQRVRPFTTLPGNETQPAFSPDGKRLAYVWSGGAWSGGARSGGARSGGGKNPAIYVRALEGGEATRITAGPAAEVSPAWSPDGSRLAFLRTTADRTAIFVASPGPAPGGRPPQMIAHVFSQRIEAVGRQLHWSPGGRELAVVDKASAAEPFAIYLVRVADGTKERLTAPPLGSIGDSSPEFSPDGTAISFLRSPSSGIGEVWVVPIGHGAAARRLTTGNRGILSQTWAPDGRTIVFSSGRTGGYALWATPARGGTPWRIPGLGSGAAEASFSPDGRYLAYAQSFLDTNLWRMQLAGETTVTGTRKLAASSVDDSSPQYSPDGRRIAFRSDRSGYHEIWVCDSEGSQATQLTHLNGPPAGTPRWSPGGRWISFDSRPDGRAGIYVVSAAGGTPRRVTSGQAEDVAASWSRDGRWIYFASNRSGSWQVWKTPPGGGAAVQVTRHGGFAAFESLDGRYVYYAIGRSQPGLYRVPVEGGTEELVLDQLGPGYWGYWAPAAGGIYFAARPEGAAQAAFYFFRLADRVPVRLAAIEKPLVTGDAAVALAPDGRALVYAQLDQSGGDIMLAELAVR